MTAASTVNEPPRLGEDRHLGAVLERATRDVFRRGHRSVSIDHIVHALIDEGSINHLLRQVKVDLPQLRADLHEHLEKITPHFNGQFSDEKEIDRSPGVAKLLDRAATIAHKDGKTEISPAHMLLAAIRLRNGVGVLLLKHAGLTPAIVQDFIAGKPYAAPATTKEDIVTDSKADQPGFKIYPMGQALQQYTTNLTALAKDGKLRPVVGNAKAVNRAVEILNRKTKNNALIVGDTGVGRKAVVEGLAHKLVFDPPKNVHFKDANIFQLQLSTLKAGAKYHGDLEERIQNIGRELSEIPNAILFIDGLHTTIGDGRIAGDMAAAIKTQLNANNFRCIAREGWDHYRREIEKDPEFNTIFQTIQLKEPSIDETYAVVEAHRPRIEEAQQVTFTLDALKACTDLSKQHIRGRMLPDKAIDLVEEVASRANLQGIGVIETTLVEDVLADIINTPEGLKRVDIKKKLRTLPEDIKAVLHHQDKAIDIVSGAIKMHHAGLKPPGKPIGSFIFSGPTGVGKTELAKQLAEILEMEFIRIDMTEYSEKHSKARLFGAPPGYVGYDGGGYLTEAVRKKPRAVLLLDEIEKAHPDVLSALLPVMDDSRMTDGQGREANFDDVIIIMTTNAGAVDRKKKSPGFTTPEKSTENEALKEFLLPEFRNRVDATVEFNALDESVMIPIVDKFIGQLNKLVLDQNIHFTLTQDAKKYLARTGFDPDNGARPMNRVINEKIKRGIADEILFGRLQKGGKVTIDFYNAANDNQAEDNRMIIGELTFVFADSSAATQLPSVVPGPVSNVPAEPYSKNTMS